MIVEANHLYSKLLDIKKAPSIRKGVSTGYQSLDELMLLSKQYLMVLTGMPSCGKSEVLDGIALNTAILHDWSWLYFTPENFPLESHLQKLVEKYCGYGIKQIPDADIKAATEWIDNHFAWVHPEDDRYSLQAIIDEVEIRIQEGHKVDAVVIDPWNELDHSAQGGMRDDQYISKSLGMVRRFHRKYNILTCIVIHPTKMLKDSSGNYPVPNLYDCNGGAMWRNKADFGLCVHRQNFEKHEASVYVQKIKNKTMGRVGKIDLDYEYTTGRFKDKNATKFELPTLEEYPF